MCMKHALLTLVLLTLGMNATSVFGVIPVPSEYRAYELKVFGRKIEVIETDRIVDGELQKEIGRGRQTCLVVGSHRLILPCSLAFAAFVGAAIGALVAFGVCCVKKRRKRGGRGQEPA